MIVTDVPIDELIPHPLNPRTMTEKQVEDLTNSIRQFGVIDPIILSGRTIIGGHQRVRIAKTLGYTTVPCVLLTLTPEEEMTLLLRLNANHGSWDFDALANNFSEELLTVVGLGDIIFKQEEEEPEKHERTPQVCECPKCGHEFPIPRRHEN